MQIEHPWLYIAKSSGHAMGAIGNAVVYIINEGFSLRPISPIENHIDQNHCTSRQVSYNSRQISQRENQIDNHSSKLSTIVNQSNQNSIENIKINWNLNTFSLFESMSNICDSDIEQN